MLELARYPDFVRLFVGRVVTNAGDSVYYIASMWLVYDLTGSTFYTGLAAFLAMLPTTLQFLFGPLVDRTPLRPLLVTTQLAQAGLVAAIPLAAWTGYLSVWLVLAVMPALSLLNQPVYPAQSAALPRIVDREDLVAANSAFSLSYQGVDAAFNALAGLLVALVGTTVLFLLDSLSFLVAALAFATLRVRPPTRDPSPGGADDAVDGRVAVDGGKSSYLSELRVGVDFVRGSVIARILVGAVVTNLAFGAAMAVLPAYGDSLGGATAYGLLTASVGGGLLVGALLASALRRFPFGRLVVVGLSISAVLWVAAVALRWLPGTVALLLLSFVPVGATNVLLLSMTQVLVPEGLLGRVTAVITSVAAGATPFGALLGGAAADALSASAVMAATGVSFALLAAYWLLSPRLRRLPRVDAVETVALD
ncbi:MFS transporter [Halomarina pelagica]|uniref:MFS transporter n=1 Tax=Halomarina pelagica TaxID=2961599 RepID=UPI0020C3EFB9|nr:MFS transporter [Halomarina sp. BND7]